MKTLNIVGGGKMGGAILAGIIRAESLSPNEIWLTEPHPATAEVWTSQFDGLGVSDAPVEAECYLVAVKPHIVHEALVAIREFVTPTTLVISIAAGVSIDSIRRSLGSGGQVVRAMPNTAALVGESMTGLVIPDELSSSAKAFVARIFEAVGQTVTVPEAQIDALTAISGSGPAYFYLLLESLEEAGVRLGLTLADARLLAQQTLKGVASMIDGATDPRTLRLNVTSPKGTTAAAIASLEKNAFRSAVFEATLACVERAEFLARS
jgi:pyrroline-5-carboxylate reductase